MLGVGVIDGNDGELEDARLLHRALTNHTGGGLFGGAIDVDDEIGVFLVNDRHDVSAVVDQDVRPVRDRCVNVPVVGLVILALDGEDGNAGVHQRRRDIILSRKGIARAHHRIGSTRLKCQREIGRLGRDVGTAEEAQTFEGSCPCERVPDLAQHRHLAASPFDPSASSRCKRWVLDVEVSCARRGCHHMKPFLLTRQLLVLVVNMVMSGRHVDRLGRKATQRDRQRVFLILPGPPVTGNQRNRERPAGSAHGMKPG